MGKGLTPEFCAVPIGAVFSAVILVEVELVLKELVVVVVV